MTLHRMEPTAQPQAPHGAHKVHRQRDLVVESRRFGCRVSLGAVEGDVGVECREVGGDQVEGDEDEEEEGAKGVGVDVDCGS
jgi:hypothetical protein